MTSFEEELYEIIEEVKTELVFDRYDGYGDDDYEERQRQLAFLPAQAAVVQCPRAPSERHYPHSMNLNLTIP